MRILIAFTLLGILISCKTYSEEDKKSFDKKIEAYLKKKDINDCVRTESGLYYKIVEKGEGRPIKFKDIVTFKYKGELLDGTVFDDQTEEPVEYTIGELIACWKEALLELNEGGKVYLVTPPQLGYANHDLDDIPPNSCLVFEIEVVDVK